MSAIERLANGLHRIPIVNHDGEIKGKNKKQT